MMELQQTQRITQGQELRQQLSQAQMQSLKLLTMTSLELQTELNLVLKENPVLEVMRYGNEVQVGDPIQAVSGISASDDVQALREDGNGLDSALYADEPSGGGDDEESRRLRYLESLTATEESESPLAEQLRDVSEGDAALRAAGEAVLGNLDGNGYLCASDEEIASQADVPLETAERAVAMIQTFEPAGIAARTPQECLLLQLERRHEKGTAAWRIVEAHLEDLSRNRIQQIAKALGLSVPEVNEAAERIRKLEPYPGRQLVSAAAPAVSPEASIEPDGEGGWVVQMDSLTYPELQMNEQYTTLAGDRNTPAETRQYLQPYISQANQIMFGLERRKVTIFRITQVLAELQKDFLARGNEWLRPMVMGDIAKELGIHETTVSRAIAGKYVRTPQGLFEYRYFFTSGYSSSSGAESSDELSSRAIREKIRRLIQQEDRTKPLSDQAIADLLAKDGVTVARRTVAKYREAEGIPATSMRREHRG